MTCHSSNCFSIVWGPCRKSTASRLVPSAEKIGFNLHNVGEKKWFVTF